MNIAWGRDERGRFVPQRIPGTEKIGRQTWSFSYGFPGSRRDDSRNLA